MKFLLHFAFLAIVAVAAFRPNQSFACACGCDVFAVGGPPLMQRTAGGAAFVEYDFMDQDHNWSGGSSAPSGENADKEIRTHFVTAGVQYMFNHSWGMMAEAPVWNREFRTENAAGDGVDAFNHTALGDIRLVGVYTGLSHDMSTGLMLGVKLPTGDWKYPGFDRDTEIGTGSTDILVGAYHTGALGRDGAWGYFVQVLWDAPVASQGGYAPGQEFDGAAGVSYNGATLAGGKVKVAPVLQLIGSARTADRGPASNAGNSGYERLMISPGVEVDAGAWRVYGDVEIPLYQRVNGDQLTASELFKLVVSRRF
jgi:hypothetical protein